MDWLLQHLQLLIAAAGGVAWWLNQRRQSRGNQAAKSQRETRQDDPDLAERTRRIREEIQRKIAERARGEVSPTSAKQKHPRPASGVPPQLAGIEPPSLARPGMTPEEAERSTAMLAKQAALAEQLRQAVESKTAALRRMRSGSETVAASERGLRPVRAAAINDLRDVGALRRAIVLREIIGPPVALR